MLLNLKDLIMAKIETISFKGCSGKSYNFDVYLVGTKFKSLGAIYFISKRQNNNHTLVYLGITDDLSTRFNNHHKEECFKKHNANCVSIHIESYEKTRKLVEEDILCNYNFPCNEINN